MSLKTRSGMLNPWRLRCKTTGAVVKSMPGLRAPVQRAGAAIAESCGTKAPQLQSSNELAFGARGMPLELDLQEEAGSLLTILI
eukprot:1200617-Amphidinium_carterae.1